jgi:chromosome segregation ATPase
VEELEAQNLTITDHKSENTNLLTQKTDLNHRIEEILIQQSDLDQIIMAKDQKIEEGRRALQKIEDDQEAVKNQLDLTKQELNEVKSRPALSKKRRMPSGRSWSSNSSKLRSKSRS